MGKRKPPQVVPQTLLRPLDSPDPHAPAPRKDAASPCAAVRAKTNEVRKALLQATAVTERDIEAFAPTDDHLLFTEALLAGCTALQTIGEYTELEPEALRSVLRDPVAMAWVSRVVQEQLRHRCALVDTSLYCRAVAGDTVAIRLYYDRMGKLEKESRIRVDHTHAHIDLRSVSDGELAALIREQTQLLPTEFTVLASGPGEGLPRPDGTPAAPERGPAALLPPPPERAPEAEKVP